MNDSVFQSIPHKLLAIEHDTEKSGFSMASERQTGTLLKTLAFSKPDGNFFELGTGTGLSTAWILSGMDSISTFDSVDNDSSVQGIAEKHLGADPRATFHCMDGAEFIRNAKPESYDLIFADAWPGKYNLLDETLDLLKIGGFYILDDMIPQPNWPEGHDAKAAELLKKLNNTDRLSICRMQWATGIVICCRTA